MAKWFPPQASTAERTGLTPDDGSIFYDEDEQTMYIGDGSTSGGNTLKGDTGPQGPPGTLTAVLDDLTPQLGGFLDPFGQFIGMDKGGDIASASPLVIGTDGDYFDVTGTTGFAVMTVAANRFFMLQFDAILIITNGASIVIPGGANFTTAVGDQLLCFSTATNTVRVLGITKADGTPIAIELSADSTPQLSGFLDPNSNYIGSDKGGDLASAASMVIGVDGDYFDVTGTTGFADFVVTNNRRFRLQFDDALTIIVGSGIFLNNGGVNFTTATGDSIDFQSIAANTVIGTITKADGTSPVAAVGGAWNLIGTVEASASASLTITGLDDTYEQYVLIGTNIRTSSVGGTLRMRFGIFSGIETDAQYDHHIGSVISSSTSYSADAQQNFTYMLISDFGGNTAEDNLTFNLLFSRPKDSGTGYPTIHGTGADAGGATGPAGGHIVARYQKSIDVDRIQIYSGSPTITSGRFSVYGISHA